MFDFILRKKTFINQLTNMYESENNKLVLKNKRGYVCFTLILLI